jgi:hypothetical protein
VLFSKQNTIRSHILYKLTDILNLDCLFRVRYSLVPSALQCIFSYLEDPGLIRDKYGNEDKEMKKSIL